MKRNKNILVGIFTFFMIVFTGVLILWQTDIVRKVQGYSVTGEFVHIGGLLDGAVVRYRGYPVGHVTSIKPGPEKIEVSFFVAKNIIIPVDSTVKILFDGLVGENYVSVEPAVDNGIYIKDNAVLRGHLASDLATFIDLGSQNLMHSEAILTTIRKIVTNPELTQNLNSIISNIYLVTNQLAKQTKNGNIGSIITNMSQSSQSLNDILYGLKDESSKHSLISIQKEISALVKGLQSFEKNLGDIGSQENSNKIKRILSHIENSSEQVSNYLGSSKKDSFISTLGKLQLGTQTNVLYDSSNSTGYFNSDIELKVGKYSLISGISNTYGEIKLMNFQHGYQINKYLKTRLGIINDSEGIGIDYKPYDKLKFSMQYYNFDKTNYTLSTMYNIYSAVDLQMQYKSDSKLTNPGIDLGVSYQF